MFNILIILMNIVISIELYTQFNTKIHAEFVTYVKVFEHSYGKKIDSTGIRFERLSKEGRTVGECYSITGNVAIDKHYWQAASELERELLILHELGHCVLDRDHIITIGNNGCPVSIMYPELIPHCYSKYRDYYIDELFDKQALR